MPVPIAHPMGGRERGGGGVNARMLVLLAGSIVPILVIAGLALGPLRGMIGGSGGSYYFDDAKGLQKSIRGEFEKSVGVMELSIFEKHAVIEVKTGPNQIKSYVIRGGNVRKFSDGAPLMGSKQTHFEQHLFPVGSLDLSVVPRMAETAKKQLKAEELSHMTLHKPLTIMGGGPEQLRWRVFAKGGSGNLDFDVGGNPLGGRGADGRAVSGTGAAVDFFKDPKTVAPAIRAKLGGNPELTELVLYPTYVIFQHHFGGKIDRYTFRDGVVGAPQPERVFDKRRLPQQVFKLDSVNFQILPTITADALKKLPYEGGKVSHVIVGNGVPFRNKLGFAVYVSGPRDSGRVEYLVDGSVHKIYK